MTNGYRAEKVQSIKENLIMSMVSEAVNIVYRFVTSVCDANQKEIVEENLKCLALIDKFTNNEKQHGLCTSYIETQEFLSRLNEKESIRKAKGVYYTPSDVVQFIVRSSINLLFGKLEDDSIKALSSDDVDYKMFCMGKTTFDPTCGAGEFLLAVMDKKFELWEHNKGSSAKEDIEAIAGTIYGNDINPDSIVITKLRLYLCAVNRYGVEKCIDLPQILNNNFSTQDYVVNPPSDRCGYDLVIGNPPYVEDVKSGLDLVESYGNIYANVLVNVARRLNNNGVLGFVIPLSYVATPRMMKLRNELYSLVPEQYILSYSDRPDCLFTSVHQKLCILLCRKNSVKRTIYTSDYRYWYKEERPHLFTDTSIVLNEYVKDDYVPKLGTYIDVAVYQKVTNGAKIQSIKSLSLRTGEPLFINMRAAFWIKAFRNPHPGAEYKSFMFESSDMANYLMCIVNSSLFWWYWTCVSDCWHITLKELVSFGVPKISDYSMTNHLAKEMEKKLEETKVYVGTKQTEYEYKHRSCVDVIHAIDNYINSIYGLTPEESEYIKSFAYQYRVSGGTINERN